VSNQILIVDDNRAARSTVRALLEWHEFLVCGEAADGKEAIKKVRELRPEIVTVQPKWANSG
jgi:YesN/AraC family two-component response regulator